MSDRTEVAIDFETVYSDEFSLSDMSPWHYTHDPRFNAYMVSLVGEELSYVGPVETAPWSQVVGKTLVAHNASFDKAVVDRLTEQGKIPDLKTPEFLCSLDLCAYSQLPRGLAQAAKEGLGVQVDKTMRAVMKGKTYEGLSTSQQQALRDYALKDSVLCKQLWDKLSPSWPTNERFLSCHTRRIGNDGLTIDLPALKGALELLRTALWNLGKMMPWFTDADIKPLSLIHIREQGRKDGIEVPGSLDLRDPDAAAWEAKYAPLFGWVRALRGYRRVNALLKKLETLERMLRPDGTAFFGLKYFGAAATGRWSGAAGWNVQNLPRSPVVVCKKCWGCNFDPEALKKDEADTLTCPFCGSSDVGLVNLRGLIVAPPGKLFVISDLAQIEARVLLWLAGDEATLSEIAKGMSVYEVYARKALGWTGGKLQDENPQLYFLAKAAVLGLGFQCSHKKFKLVASSLAGLDLSAEECVRAVADYRAASPGITERWRRHGLWLRVSVNHQDPTHEVGLRSGRTIRYFDPHILEGSDPTFPEIVANTVKGDSRQLRRFFGGKLTENEVQATARDVLGEGITALEKSGVPVSFHAHDEVICVVDEKDAKASVPEIERTLTTAAKWATLPLAAKTIVVPRYCK